MKNLLILFILANIALGQEVNFDRGRKFSDQIEYGKGEHYVYSLEFDKINTPKFISKLDKGDDHYTLTLTHNLVFILNTTQTSTRQISVKFKLMNAFRKYLVDIVHMNNGEFIIALTSDSYGYDFIKFKKVNGSYQPYIYANAFILRSLIEGDDPKAKEVGFNVDGSFYIRKTNNTADIYKFNNEQNGILRNDAAFATGHVNVYNRGLPDRLKITE